jgi:hypothetical protein
MGGIIVPEQSTLDTPPSGFFTIGVKADGRVYFKNDAGVEGLLISERRNGTSIGAGSIVSDDIVLDIDTPWGIDPSTGPYFDSDGAASGEEAILTIDGSGAMLLVPVADLHMGPSINDRLTDLEAVHASGVGAFAWFTVAISDEATAITTGTAKVTFRMPFAMTLLAGNAGVRASLNTASSSGIPTFDVNEGGATILSTKLTIDASEKTSLTAATAVVISDTALADDAEITIDVDVAGTGAKGAKIMFRGVRAS